MRKTVKIIFLLSTFIFTLKPLLATTNDFKSHKDWTKIQSNDHTGDQKLLTLKDTKQEKVVLYWMGPNSTTKIQSHAIFEEVTIVKGDLYWLNEDNSIQRTLTIGDHVDRKPNVAHGPFRAGSKGCLMYVRFHV